MAKTLRLTLAALSVAALAACSDQELGSEIDAGQFGNSTMNNTLIQAGLKDYVQELGGRFSREVPDTVNFAFNSSKLESDAKKILSMQAQWIRQFPEVRFRVYGHTDLVGSDAYNKALGMQRAQAVVKYLSSQGIDRSRLEAVVSYGKTRPLIQTTNEERQNRRTVTEVTGFVKRHPTVLNGKYAEVIFREYVREADRIHPSNTQVSTQVSESGG